MASTSRRRTTASCWTLGGIRLAEAQAIDRAHRIGQEKPVYVYRLVAKDTIESKVLALQAKKTQLFNDVLGDESQAGQQAALNADDFLALMS
ncbi:DEAD/DEAH box helicase [Glutamicibacter halophytocola]|uniref:DEAD/DEAH box helicase n=1 Tax=Glutamicibacter halophytocola TaxID=1933880 RepID=UPI00321BF08F